MQRLKYIKWFLLGAVFFAGVAYAAPVYNTATNLLPAQNDTYDLGSTSPALEWKNVYTKNITISGTCTGCGSGTAYPFPLTGNATSTLTQFNGGLTSFASSTIGDGTIAGGLTISGGATTTSLSFGSYVDISAGTNHLNLWGTIYGFGVTSGRVNYNSGGSHVFNVNGSEKARVDVSGKFAIGTSSPSAYLSLVVPTNGFAGLGVYGTTAGTPSVSSAAFLSGQFWPSSGLYAINNQAQIAGNTSFDFRGYYSQLGVPSGVTVSGNLADIYLDTPSISGTVSGSKYAIYSADTNNSYFAGNVGIATTTPDRNLTVYGKESIVGPTSELLIDPYSAVTSPKLGFQGTRAMFGYDTATANAVVQSGAGKGIEFNVNNATFGSGQAAVITSAGNFGISTTSPYKTLSVGGDVVIGASTAGGTLGNLFLPAVSGILKAGTGGQVSAAANGTDFTLITAKTCNAGDFVSAVTAAGSFTCATPSSGSAYPFALTGNATSTLTQFNGGLTALASSTVGDGTTAGGLTISGGATSTGKFVGTDANNSWTGIVSPTHGFVLGTGTTTTWTASTTGTAYSPYIVMPWAGTLKNVQCATDASFLGVNVQVNGSNATPSYFVASTTIGTVSFTAGNTFSAGQKVLVNFGTTTSASTLEINCTFSAIQTS